MGSSQRTSATTLSGSGTAWADDLRLSNPALMPFEILNAVRFSRSSLDVRSVNDVAKSLPLYPVELHGLECAWKYFEENRQRA